MGKQSQTGDSDFLAAIYTQTGLQLRSFLSINFQLKIKIGVASGYDIGDEKCVF